MQQTIWLEIHNSMNNLIINFKVFKICNAKIGLNIEKIFRISGISVASIILYLYRFEANFVNARFIIFYFFREKNTVRKRSKTEMVKR